MHLSVSCITLVILLGLVAGSFPFDWQKFKQDHHKSYESAVEEAARKQIFLDNVQRMHDYERLYPHAKFTLAINHLFDRKLEELVSRPRVYPRHLSNKGKGLVRSMDVPDTFDWRLKGVITPVKNQGPTGQTSAIVSVEVVESLNAIQTQRLEEGSVDRIVDCCTEQLETLQCILKQGGICRAADYPATTGQCIPNKCRPFARFTKIVRLKDQNEDTMINWIQNSTLFVGIDASNISFQAYQNGVYDDPSCSTTTVDHVMQLVGYGKTDSGDLFWICKNTWGVEWGEQGYVRVLRGKNACGIAAYVTQIA